MFERFTERARVVVTFAQEEARVFGHDYIGTEHVLLGLLREEEGLAARVLEGLEVTIDRARAHVVRMVGENEEKPVGQIPFTPRAKKVMELALREALSIGHNYIGTEHLLLGLLGAQEGVGNRVLVDLVGRERESVDDVQERIRQEVIRMLAGPGRPRRRVAEPLTEAMIRGSVGKLTVVHSRVPALRGILKSYDWGADACEVLLDGISGVRQGETLWVERTSLRTA